MTRQPILSVTREDLVVSYFSGTGAGGQHRNKHANCVRIRHPESGAAATGQSSRSRTANLREALEGIASHPKFRLWQTARVHEIKTGKSIEQKVDESMSAGNIRVEGKDETGRWVEIQ